VSTFWNSFVCMVLLLLVGCENSGRVAPADEVDKPEAFIAPDTEAVVPRGERLLGMDISMAADGDYDAAFALAKETGVQTTSLTVLWDEIETGPGLFDPDPNWLAIANLYYPPRETPVALTIVVIDTFKLRLPADLADRPLDDPEIIARYNGLLDYVASQIPDLDLAALDIGHEIDGYLGTDAAHWKAYESFFRETAAHARTLWPGVPVGSKAMFAGLTGAAAGYLQSVNSHSDAVFVSYYPLQEDATVKDPSVVHDDLAQLVAAYPQRPIYLLETGYPSGAAGASSEARQAEFVRQLFQAWDQHAGQIGLVLFAWQTDLPPDSVEGLTDYYGIGNKAFASYLATLGLRTYEGADKAAFRQLTAEADARGW
jgi:hypothetical protein